MNKGISLTQLEEFEKDFHRDPAKRVAQLAVTANGVNQSATDPFPVLGGAEDRAYHQPEILGALLDVRGAEHHAGGGHDKAEPGGFRALPELPALLRQAGEVQLLP